MSLATRSPSLLAAWLCAAAGWGCPAAQVKPPEPANCPKEAQEAMSQELKLTEGSAPDVLVDINQPEDPYSFGVYQDGPVIGRITRTAGNLPKGTLLHGRLWTGPTIVQGRDKEPAVMARYTQAVLPDGRKYPVCIVLGNPDGLIYLEGKTQSGAFLLSRVYPVSIVSRWP